MDHDPRSSSPSPSTANSDLPVAKKRKTRHSDSSSAIDDPHDSRGGSVKKTNETNSSLPLPPVSLGDVFTIRPHGESNEKGSLSLKPVTLVPRARIPLSWLDPCYTSSRRLGSGRLFTADIPCLQTHPPGHWRRREPLTLAARLVSSKPRSSDTSTRDELYVLEKVTKNVYAVCALGAWVQVDDLQAAGAISKTSGSCHARESEQQVPSMPPSRHPTPTPDDSGIQIPSDAACDARATADAQEDEIIAESKELRTCLRPDEDKQTTAMPTPRVGSGRDMTARPVCTTTAEVASTSSAATSTPPTGTSVGHEANQPPPLIDLLDQVRRQYLDALYASRSSVAYFAKGPLSRVRAVFSQTSSGLDLSDLAAFYRQCVLQIKRMDLKYRETIPTTVRDLVCQLAITSTDTQSMPRHVNKKKGKRRNTNRPSAIARNGLYPDEEEYIATWFRERDAEGGSATSDATRQEGDRKRLISELRLRETQLQILIILEAMALEKAISATGRPASKLSLDLSDKAPKRPRKPQDLAVLLDLLVDRLCIWFTVSYDGAVASTGQGDSRQSSSAAEEGEAKLREFALEVIMPFYHSRLPDQCKKIARKLNVSLHSTPRHTSSTATTKSKAVTPGTAVKRRRFPVAHPRSPTEGRRAGASGTTRSSLQRVLTDERAAQARPRVRNFSRSTSDIHDLRRSQIDPSASSATSSFSKDILVTSTDRPDHREVDLEAVGKQHENKIKRMSQLFERRRDLDAATHSSRRSSRTGALAISEDVSTSGNAGGVDAGRDGLSRPHGQAARATSSHKPKNPMRIPHGQAIQVMATPTRHNSRRLARHMSLMQSPSARLGKRHAALTQPAAFAPLAAGGSRGSGMLTQPRHVTSAVWETPSKERLTLGLQDGLEEIDELPFRTPGYSRQQQAVALRELPMTPRTLGRAFSVPDSTQKPGSLPALTEATARDSHQDRISAPLAPVTDAPHSTHPGKGEWVSQASPDSASLQQTTDNRVNMQASPSLYRTLGWDNDDTELAVDVCSPVPG
ncbi:hypothetical protein KEM52_001217 [Ascosphaera acerosa]|nr:hypothetical protein KEM52_001217 [Ascosphaera acerosa]